MIRHYKRADFGRRNESINKIDCTPVLKRQIIKFRRMVVKKKWWQLN